MSAPTGADALSGIRVASDALDVSADGRLRIGGQDALALAERFGSPLQVIVADTIRANYRRVVDVFSARWPARVSVLYSVKANNTLAIRALLAREGAGGDCFGLGELGATLSAGTDPARVAMNGSNKDEDEVEAALRAGAAVNVDSTDEVGFLRRLCARGLRARVNLRLKVLPTDLDRHVEEARPTPGGYVEGIRRVKWGFLAPAAIRILEDLRSIPGVDVIGLSCHVGHLSSAPAAFATVADAIGRAVADVHAATGFVPRILDIGGGWPPDRDPSFRKPGRSGVSIEEIADATLAALRAALPQGVPTPELWIEPGRFLVSNAVVLLGRVGAIKTDAGICWAHADISTNNLPRIETGLFHYTVLPASRMHAPMDATVQVVGSTCFKSVIGADRPLPPLARGDLLAVLDAGAYAEVFANQFNALPRPASVMISEHGVEIVRERESIADIFRLHRVPAWLSA